MRQLKISKQLTNRDSRSIDKYLSDVSKEKMITAEREVELAQRIKQGDNAALREMVNANLRFVISVAKQYQGHGLNLEDLIAEGNIGLIVAAKRFDETKGFKFISYAVWWIRQSIMQSIAEHSRVVRLPLNKVSAIQKVANEFARLEQELERAPTQEEISQHMDTTEESVTNLQVYSQRQVSVDAPLADEDDHSLLNLLAFDGDSPETEMLQDSLRRDIERLLHILPTREADILRYTYGLCGSETLTLEEIGMTMELTRERIRQIRDKALRKLRKRASRSYLNQYL